MLFELPYVADCCVVGAPNEEWGEEVLAVVELLPPDAPAPEAAEDAIREDGAAGRARASSEPTLSPSVPRSSAAGPA